MRRKTWNSWTFSETDDRPERDDENRTKIEPRETTERQRKQDEMAGLEQAFQPDMGKMLERAMDLSEVRMERVERVKASLARGEYDVSADDLARKLIDTMRGDFR